MMTNRDEIEIVLWDYIDGNLDAAEQQRVTELIAKDVAWKQAYESLLALHEHAGEIIPAEQPSMRFSKNVMEAIAHMRITPATRKYINTRLVKGMAAFFLLAIFGLLGYALFQFDFGSIPVPSVADNLPVVPKGKMMDLMKYVMLPLNIIAAVVLADEYRSRKIRMKKANSQML
jgi:hypothetical protein